MSTEGSNYGENIRDELAKARTIQIGYVFKEITSVMESVGLKNGRGPIRDMGGGAKRWILRYNPQNPAEKDPVALFSSALDTLSKRGLKLEPSDQSQNIPRHAVQRCEFMGVSLRLSLTN